MPVSKKKDEIRIATILGIPVKLDISWFLIFFLVAWTLALGYFPHDYPGFSLLIYWTMGIICWDRTFCYRWCCSIYDLFLEKWILFNSENYG